MKKILTFVTLLILATPVEARILPKQLEVEYKTIHIYRDVIPSQYELSNSFGKVFHLENVEIRFKGMTQTAFPENSVPIFEVIIESECSPIEYDNYHDLYYHINRFLNPKAYEN